VRSVRAPGDPTGAATLPNMSSSEAKPPPRYRPGSDGGRDRARAALIAPATVLSLLVLLWAATAGPSAVLSPSGRRLTFDSPQDTPSASVTSTAPGSRADPRDAPQTLDLHWLGDLLAWAVVIAFGVGLLVALGLAWRNRWRRPEAAPVVAFDVLPAAEVARVLADDLDSHIDAVTGGAPRDAIVRCWLRLEESVAAAGLPRRPFETSAEFTVRVLHRLDLDPRAIGALAALYREARFSEHELDEGARTAAREALELLHEDLRRTAAST
jgi:hypothetical protein